jgi:hypothetical protein
MSPSSFLFFFIFPPHVYFEAIVALFAVCSTWFSIESEIPVVASPPQLKCQQNAVKNGAKNKRGGNSSSKFLAFSFSYLLFYLILFVLSFNSQNGLEIAGQIQWLIVVFQRPHPSDPRPAPVSQLGVAGGE